MSYFFMYFLNSQMLQALPMEQELDNEGIGAHVLKEQYLTFK